MKSSSAALVVAAIVVLGVATWLPRGKTPGGVDPALTAVVRKGTVETVLRVRGALKSARSVPLSSAIERDRATVIGLVSEGSLVKKGDTVITFDSSPFKEEIAQLEDVLKKAEISFKMQIEGEEQIKLQELDFQRRKAESLVQERRQSLKEQEELFGYGFVPEERVREARRALSDAEHDLEIAQLRYENSVTIRFPMAVEQASQGMVEVRRKLEDARRELEACTLSSPVDGLLVLVPVNVRGEFRKITIGDSVWHNQPIALVSEIAQMRLVAQVPEDKLHMTRIGQEATVSVNAFPEMALAAVVDSVGTVSAPRGSINGPGNERREFDVGLSIVDTVPALRPGMGASATIRVERRDDVLVVPLQGVFHDDGGFFAIQIREDGDRQVLARTAITVGISNETDAEVLAGLDEGAKISLVEIVP